MEHLHLGSGLCHEYSSCSTGKQSGEGRGGLLFQQPLPALTAAVSIKFLTAKLSLLPERPGLMLGIS